MADPGLKAMAKQMRIDNDPARYLLIDLQ